MTTPVCHIYAAHPVRAHGAPTEDGHIPIWLTPRDAMGELYSEGDVDFLRRLFD